MQIVRVSTHDHGSQTADNSSVRAQRSHRQAAMLVVLAAIVAVAFAVPAGAAAEDAAAAPQDGPGLRLADVSSLEQGTVSAATRSQGERSAQTRIVGGSTTTVEAWPWQVALTMSPDLYGGSAYDRMFCGGSLVAPRVVVTAAHCLYHPGTSSFTDPSDYAIVSGRTRLSSSAGQEIPFDTYHVLVDAAGNPVYDDVSARWDLAVVQLAAPSGAQPIQLAGPDEEAVWADGAGAFVTGWGATVEGGAASDVLRATPISMIGDRLCAEIFGLGQLELASMVCAGVLEGGRDACQGDSGGPLVAPLAGGGFRLVGDTSWGYGCAQPGTPGVYGRVAEDPMRGFIRQAALAIDGVDAVGSGGRPALSIPPIAPGPGADELTEAACSQALRALDRSKKRLRKAKRQLLRAKAKGKPGQRSRRKIARAKRKMKYAKQELAAAC